jgi:hypothetical protein
VKQFISVGSLAWRMNARRSFATRGRLESSTNVCVVFLNRSAGGFLDKYVGCVHFVILTLPVSPKAVS